MFSLPKCLRIYVPTSSAQSGSSLMHSLVGYATDKAECVHQNVFDVAYREHLSRFIKPTLPLNNVGRNVVLMMVYTID